VLGCSKVQLQHSLQGHHPQRRQLHPVNRRNKAAAVLQVFLDRREGAGNSRFDLPSQCTLYLNRFVQAPLLWARATPPVTCYVTMRSAGIKQRQSACQPSAGPPDAALLRLA
jgi:hypothetical protein